MKKYIFLGVVVLIAAGILLGCFFFESNSYISQQGMNTISSSTSKAEIDLDANQSEAIQALVKRGVNTTAYPTPIFSVNYLYIIRSGQSGGTMYVYDIKDPSNPVLLSTYNPGFYQITGFYIHDSRMYLALSQAGSNDPNLDNPPGGLQIVNISNPANPIKISTFDIEPLNGIVGFGNYLITSNTFSLKTYSLSSPDSPKHIETYTQNGDIKDIQQIDMVGTTTLRMTVDLKNANPYNNRYVQLIDISDPTNLTVSSSTPYSDYGFYKN